MKQIKRFGGKTPDRVLNRPKLAPGLKFYLDAFYELDTERNLTDLQPIPWSSIVHYADRYETNEEDLLYLIRAADNEYLKSTANKQKRR